MTAAGSRERLGPPDGDGARGSGPGEGDGVRASSLGEGDGARELGPGEGDGVRASGPGEGDGVRGVGDRHGDGDDASGPGYPPFSRGPLDRAAHRRLDEAWLAAAWARARVVVVDDGHVLVRPGEPPELVLISAAEAPAGERFFLGEDADGAVYFAVAADVAEAEGTSRVTLRQVGHALPDLPAGLFITAVALANWHSRHPYSPLSGRLTVPAQGGWVRVTEDGEETLWPRTDPAVIMLVHDGVAGPDGRCLLGFNAQWKVLGTPVPRFSTLAGFVEPGESAEMAVAREVLEEVGVRVGDVTYVASQPWPFPGSLMLGFHARAAAGAAITVDVEEIAEARWFTRTEIASVLDGSSTSFGLPFPASIAHFLITEWLHGRP